MMNASIKFMLLILLAGNVISKHRGGSRHHGSNRDGSSSNGRSRMDPISPMDIRSAMDIPASLENQRNEGYNYGHYNDNEANSETSKSAENKEENAESTNVENGASSNPDSYREGTNNPENANINGNSEIERLPADENPSKKEIVQAAVVSNIVIGTQFLNGSNASIAKSKSGNKLNNKNNKDQKYQLIQFDEQRLPTNHGKFPSSARKFPIAEANSKFQIKKRNNNNTSSKLHPKVHSILWHFEQKNPFSPNTNGNDNDANKYSNKPRYQQSVNAEKILDVVFFIIIFFCLAYICFRCFQCLVPSPAADNDEREERSPPPADIIRRGTARNKYSALSTSQMSTQRGQSSK